MNKKVFSLFAAIEMFVAITGLCLIPIQSGKVQTALLTACFVLQLIGAIAIAAIYMSKKTVDASGAPLPEPELKKQRQLVYLATFGSLLNLAAILILVLYTGLGRSATILILLVPLILDAIGNLVVSILVLK